MDTLGATWQELNVEAEKLWPWLVELRHDQRSSAIYALGAGLP